MTVKPLQGRLPVRYSAIDSEVPLGEIGKQIELILHSEGKQIVYHALQSESDALSTSDLSAMDSAIEAYRRDIGTLKSNEKLLRQNISSVNATLGTPDLRLHVEELEADKMAMLTRLGPLRKGEVKPVKAEEKIEVDRSLRAWKRMADARKMIALELWSVSSEEIPEGKTKDELWVSQ